MAEPAAPAAPQALIEFSAKVPEAEFERFKRLVPPYGGTTWFINTALVAFNDAMEADASLPEQVEAAVKATLSFNRLAREQAGAPGDA